MALVITGIKVVAGLAVAAYIATRKVETVKDGGIIIDYRTNPEVLNGIIDR